MIQLIQTLLRSYPNGKLLWNNNGTFRSLSRRQMPVRNSLSSCEMRAKTRAESTAKDLILSVKDDWFVYAPIEIQKA